MGGKNKYLFMIILFHSLIFLAFCTSNTFVQAEKTDVGIGFEESTCTTIDSSNPEIPIILKPIGPNRETQLPHLGQMLSSIILLLIGLGIVIIFIGIFALKKLCYNDLKEV
ncbi:hypothetical protein JZO73_14270 [Enterococcus plantarum]|uniref:hypothetical protein n=1 Tax=Enterococcus plantarum TaxID=1077675 RepID=UPI001A8C7AFD|nr:hypothetical protein [Enterococcus plantarum]MBO0468671.1 hypothetical protein [Enterococcus plantarum]